MAGGELSDGQLGKVKLDDDLSGPMAPPVRLRRLEHRRVRQGLLRPSRAGRGAAARRLPLPSPTGQGSSVAALSAPTTARRLRGHGRKPFDMTAPAATPVLETIAISKSFPGVQALEDVELQLYPGEVTALVGENGAGKSTLVKILTGVYAPDAGRILLDGADVDIPNAEAAFHRGITAIHQETVLFDELTVTENIFLGHPLTGRFGLLDWKAMRARTRAILDGARGRPRPRRAPARPRHRPQASRRHRPRAVGRRQDRHHGRADRRALPQGGRGALHHHRQAQARGQGDPLHQPQVRRDLPHRRPLCGLPRRPPGRRRPGRRRHPVEPDLADGRPHRRPHLPQGQGAARRDRADRRRLLPPDRVR